jgi:hypothetical protein
MKPSWLRQLIKLIRPLLPDTFCGQIEINVFMGGIRAVNVRQSFKDDEEGDGLPRKPLSRLPGPDSSASPTRAVAD